MGDDGVVQVVVVVGFAVVVVVVVVGLVVVAVAVAVVAGGVVVVICQKSATWMVVNVKPSGPKHGVNCISASIQIIFAWFWP